MKKYILFLIFLLFTSGCENPTSKETIVEKEMDTLEENKDGQREREIKVSGYFNAFIVDKIPDYSLSDKIKNALLLKGFQSEIFVLNLSEERIRDLHVGREYRFVLEDYMETSLKENCLETLKEPIEIMTILRPKVVDISLVDGEGFENYQIDISPIISRNRDSKKEKLVSDFMKIEVERVLSPYYEILNTRMEVLKTEITDERYSMEFSYRIDYKNFYKDPDKVDYIREAKEKSSRDYQTMYEEYLEEKMMNLEEMKAEIGSDGSLEIYTNISPNGIDWVSFKMDDLILK